MNSIQKFLNRHIDLSKIVAVGEPTFDFSNAWDGGPFIQGSVAIHFQLMDNPVVLTGAAESWWDKTWEDGTISWEVQAAAKNLVKENFQKKVDEIIAAWQGYKNEN